ncbi:MAG: CBS domain-containing protein [Candidatus Ranarchaeia archaeon]
MTPVKFRLPTSKDLKELRRDKNYTQTQLAELSGVSQSLIARIENGTVNPRISTLNSILSVLYGDEHEPQKVLASDIATRNLIIITTKATVNDAIKTMNKHSISQLPVVSESGAFVGSVTEKKLIIYLSQQGSNGLQEKMETIMDPPFPRIMAKTTLREIERLLVDNTALLVEERRNVIGIITKSDLLQFFQKNL